MYQVSDTELFGLAPPPVDNDFTLQRSLEPGEGINDVLNWLGLPHTGAPMRGGMAEDPGGGWGWRGGRNWEHVGAKGAVRSQLMEMESDEYGYIDYSCFYSGLVSPDLDSEFFVKPTFDCPATRFDVSTANHPWEIVGSTPGVSSGLVSDRPHSPFFRFDADFCYADCSIPVMEFEETPVQDEFDSEAEAKVKEIARYLASFEVPTWSISDQQRMNNVTMTKSLATTASWSSSSSSSPPFPVINSSIQFADNQCDSTKSSAASKISTTPRVFHPGYDDTCFGLESTMVNPNEVFPDRIDRSDHQYASRSYHHKPPVSRAANIHSQRPPPPTPRTMKEGVSVLEALLRSNEPIDPNKGSGAALSFDRQEKLRGLSGDRSDVEPHTANDGMLKKFLIGKTKDHKSGRGPGSRRGEEQYHRSGSNSPNYAVPGSVENAFNAICPGQMLTGFQNIETSANFNKQTEIEREQNHAMLQAPTRNPTSELMRLL